MQVLQQQMYVCDACVYMYQLKLAADLQPFCNYVANVLQYYVATARGCCRVQ